MHFIGEGHVRRCYILHVTDMESYLPSSLLFWNLHDFLQRPRGIADMTQPAKCPGPGLCPNPKKIVVAETERSSVSKPGRIGCHSLISGFRNTHLNYLTGDWIDPAWLVALNPIVSLSVSCRQEAMLIFFWSRYIDSFYGYSHSRNRLDQYTLHTSFLAPPLRPERRSSIEQATSN